MSLWPITCSFLCVTMYFLLYVKLIEFELQYMANALHLYRICTNSRHSQLIWNVVSKQYQRIFMLTNQINTFFGWSHLATMLVCFYTILAYVSFFYQESDRGFGEHGSFCQLNSIHYRIFSFSILWKIWFFSDHYALISALRICYTLSIIFQLFSGALRCEKMVNFLNFIKLSQRTQIHQSKSKCLMPTSLK